MTSGEQMSEQLFRDETLEVIKAAQGLGYLSVERVEGDLEDVLNHVAERAFSPPEDPEAPQKPEVTDIQRRLYKVRKLTEEIRMPFFGITVVTDEKDGSISLVFGD